MEGFQHQITMGLPPLWRSIRCEVSLPKQVSVQCATTDGFRKIAFMLVNGHMRSAMPLFNANSELRNQGFETVWIFNGSGIPSTKHMLCAALSHSDGNAKVSILNTQGTCLQLRDEVSISELAKAATDQRLKSAGFTAGQLVDVTFIAEERNCAHCGTVVHELEQATFYQGGEPNSPGLALKKPNLGRCVVKLIADAVGSQPAPAAGLCAECTNLLSSPRYYSLKVTKSIGGVQLSNVAALELIRFQTTAWYIS